MAVHAVWLLQTGNMIDHKNTDLTLHTKIDMVQNLVGDFGRRIWWISGSIYHKSGHQ